MENPTINMTMKVENADSTLCPFCHIGNPVVNPKSKYFLKCEDGFHFAYDIMCDKCHTFVGTFVDMREPEEVTPENQFTFSIEETHEYERGKRIH